nr:hypothetical protein CFP56_74971 [Quercus suber]
METLSKDLHGGGDCSSKSIMSRLDFIINPFRSVALSILSSLEFPPPLSDDSDFHVVSSLQPDRSNDRDDTHDRYTTSLAQHNRPELVSAFYRAHLRDYSRPSSSSGSNYTLRRTPRAEEPRASRLRTSSLDVPRRRDSVSPQPKEQEQQQQQEPPSSPERRPSPQRPHHRRATSAFHAAQPPHPALRISKRTHTAILFAVEEAIRNPNPFTPDLQEEYAEMASLGAPAGNGGVRAGGPVPVVSGAPLRTPRDIMRERTARDAKRMEEQKAEEYRRVTEERKRSAERRLATVPGATPRFSQSSSQYTPDVSAQQGAFDVADRRASRNSGVVAGSDVLGEPVGRAQDYPASRARGASLNHSDQPRSAQTTAGGGVRRTQQSQGAPRQPAPQSTASAGAASSSTAQPQTRNTSNTSAFPHAFERWETLSSHWEGLTSYWLHKLEQNTEEIRNTVPSASTLNRQITDLSAAGANLFHAVVELQRLRASSERKFQRWFFETRADTERSQENLAKLESQLRLERNQREESAQKRAAAEEAAQVASYQVAEMKRELMISKDEARRAWEELGKRNQESLETAQSLKDGRITIVAGVQVVPYFGGPSRSGSANQRPATRDGQQYYASAAPASAAAAAGMQTPGDESAYYREVSPTDTDPFTETARHRQPMVLNEPGKPTVSTGTHKPYRSATGSAGGAAALQLQLQQQREQQQPPSGSRGTSRSQPGSSGSLGASRLPSTDHRAISPGQESPQFYQQDSGNTNIHAPSSSLQRPQPGPTQARSRSRHDNRTEVSYVDSHGEDLEYAAESAATPRRTDDYGQPTVSQRTLRSTSESDEFDPADREPELDPRTQAYHASPSQLLPEAPSVPATAAQAMASFTPTTMATTAAGAGPELSATSGPDYEGSSTGYGDWDALMTRHHHPTRLSDVLEEEEERSSRRTAE